MNRPNHIAYFLGMAELVATRGTCARRAVGCVLTNIRGHVLATGFNGVASGLEHCTDKPCPGAKCASGEGLELCEAIHAEQNALLQCHDVQTIEACYCTTAPCITCTKLLLNTSCQVIWFLEDYPQAAAAKKLWISAGRIWGNAAESILD